MLEFILIFLIMALLSYVVIFFIDIVYFIPSVFMRRKKFECIRCGHCCTKMAPLNEEEIRTIESHGHRRKDFAAGFGPFRTLRRKNGKCVFLSFSGKEAACSIYPYRTGVCRKFPLRKILGVQLVNCKCQSLRRRKTEESKIG